MKSLFRMVNMFYNLTQKQAVLNGPQAISKLSLVFQW